jgi:hypothetical protein
MAIDGFERDVPDTAGNAASFYAGKSRQDADRPAFPKVRVVTISEGASHAVVDAEIDAVAGKGAGEQALARLLYRRLKQDWLLIAAATSITGRTGAPPRRIRLARAQ